MSLGRREYTFKETFKTIKTIQPTLHEMDILEHNPVTLLSTVKDSLLGSIFLTLTHGNIDETAIVSRYIKCSSNSFDIRSGVNTREKYEEDRNSLRSFLESFNNVEGRLFNISFTHLFVDELTQSRGKSIRT